MKSASEAALARAQVGALMNMHGTDPHVSPEIKACLTGMYAAMCWVMEVDNVPAQDFAQMLGGYQGDLLRPVQALNVKRMGPKPKDS